MTASGLLTPTRRQETLTPYLMYWQKLKLATDATRTGSQSLNNHPIVLP
jgi:hypothetical protein